MAFKNWRIPAREDIVNPDKLKNFSVAPEGQFAINTTRKMLQKFGFIPSFGIQFFDDFPIGISPFGTLVFDSLNGIL